jgi:hypothetical protein
MTKQTINLGAAANDHGGDTLRAGGAKINANFDEVYGAVDLTPAYTPGAWHCMMETQLTDSGPFGGNTAFFLPFEIVRPGTIDQLGLRVASGASGTSCQLAIYAAGSLTNLKRPTGAPVAATGGIDCSTSGFKSGDVTNVTVAPGMYWLAFNNNQAGGSIAVKTEHVQETRSARLYGTTSTPSAAGIFLSLSQGYGTWPTYAGTESFAENQGNGLPVTWIKWA